MVVRKVNPFQPEIVYFRTRMSLDDLSFAVNEKLIASVEYNKHLGFPWDENYWFRNFHQEYCIWLH